MTIRRYFDRTPGVEGDLGEVSRVVNNYITEYSITEGVQDSEFDSAIESLNARIESVSDRHQVIGTASGDTTNDLSKGHNIHIVSTSGSWTPIFTNIPSTGIVKLTLTVNVTNDNDEMALPDVTWLSLVAGSVTHYVDVTFPSSVAQGDNASGWRCPATGTLVRAEIWCDVAPDTAVVTVDLHKNGTTVFTTQSNRPSIAVSATDDLSGTPEVTSMSAGDKFQFQVDALNAGDAGAIGQLICRIVWTET